MHVTLMASASAYETRFTTQSLVSPKSRTRFANHHTAD
jgi:hypothetical protein